MNRSARFTTFVGVSAGLMFTICGCGLFGGKPQNQPQSPYQHQPQRPYVAMASAENAISMPDAGKEDAVVVTVLRDGAVFLGSDKIDPSDLSLRVRDRLANRVDKEAYLRADARANFRTVEDVLDSLSAADVDDVGLLIARKDAQQSYLEFQRNLTGFELLVPSASIGKQHSAGPLPPKDVALVQILKGPGGTPAYRINHVDVQKTELLPKLTTMYKNRAERVLFIQADDNLDFASVVEVIDLAKDADVDRIAALTPQMLAGHRALTRLPSVMK